jgi:hypothetical protein
MVGTLAGLSGGADRRELSPDDLRLLGGGGSPLGCGHPRRSGGGVLVYSLAGH